MGSATRAALAAAKESLSAQRGVTLASGEQLLSAGRAIESSAPLRGILVDPAVDVAEKSTLLGSLFGKLDPAASALLLALVGERWSSPEQLLDGIEEIGIRAIAASAPASADIVGQLFAVNRAVSSDPELELALGSSLSDRGAKAELVDRLLAQAKNAEAAAIIRHLVQSPRGRRIGELLRSAAEIVADSDDRIVATVTAAAPLTSAQQKKLESSLAEQYGRPPVLDVVLDERVLGGLRVQVGDEVVDGTIASRLADLRLQLAG